MARLFLVRSLMLRTFSAVQMGLSVGRTRVNPADTRQFALSYVCGWHVMPVFEVGGVR